MFTRCPAKLIVAPLLVFALVACSQVGVPDGEDPVPYAAACPPGTEVRVTVWIRVSDEGGWLADCEPAIEVRLDGQVAELVNCVTPSAPDLVHYHGIYQGLVKADATLSAVDVTDTTGRRLSIGQQFGITEQECLGGEAWRFVTVEYVR